LVEAIKLFIKLGLDTLLFTR